MALIVGSNEQAKQHLQMAMDLFEQEGLNHDAARVSARMGEADWMDGRLEDAIERMEKALPLLSTEDPDEGLATLLAQLARLHYFKGNIDMASERIEEALAIAEPMWFPSVVAHGLVTKALVLEARSRPEESTALMKHGLELALEHDDLDAAGRACNNLATFLFPRGQIEAAKEYASQGHALALKLGSGSQARFVGAKLVYIAMHIGDWDRALGLIEELFEGETPEEPASLVFLHASFIHLQRGDFAGAGEWLSKVAWVEGSENVDWQIGYSVGRAQILIAEGNAREALGVARDALDKARAVAPSSLGAGEGFVEAVEAAIRSGEFDIAEETLNMAESLRPGEAGPIIRAFAARFRAGLLAARGKDDAVEPKFEEASGLFRELGFLFWLAVVLLEYGEWLTGLGRVEEATPLLDEAREIFERLKARPWLERLEKLLPEREVARA
jgi:tetratricopeptide (TPR) repeat protein